MVKGCHSKEDILPTGWSVSFLLVPSLLWYVDEGVVAGLEVEGSRPFDDQVGHLKLSIIEEFQVECSYFRGQHGPVGRVCSIAAGEELEDGDQLLEDEEDAGHEEPLPEVFAVEDGEDEEEVVEQVREVEHLQEGALCFASPRTSWTCAPSSWRRPT